MNSLTEVCRHPIMTEGDVPVLIILLAVNLFVIYQALRPQQENPHEHHV